MSTKKMLLPVALAVAVFGSLEASAQSSGGYATSTPGAVKNPYGLCWRSSFWTREMATAECDPDLVPKPAAAPAPAPTPAPPAPPPPPQTHAPVAPPPPPNTPPGPRKDPVRLVLAPGLRAAGVAPPRVRPGPRADAGGGASACAAPGARSPPAAATSAGAGPPAAPAQARGAAQARRAHHR